MATREEILEKARAAKKAKAKEMVVKQVAIPPSVAPTLGSAFSGVRDIQPIPLDMPEDYDFGEPDPNWRPPTRMDQMKGMMSSAASLAPGIGEAAQEKGAATMEDLRRMLESGRTSAADMITPDRGFHNGMGLDPSMMDKMRNSIAGAIRPEQQYSPEDTNQVLQQIGEVPGKVVDRAVALPGEVADYTKALPGRMKSGIEGFLNKGIDAIGGATSRGMEALPQPLQDPNSMMNMQRQRMMELEQERLRQEEEWRAKMQKANMMQQQRGGRTGA